MFKKALLNESFSFFDEVAEVVGAHESKTCYWGGGTHR